MKSNHAFVLVCWGASLLAVACATGVAVDEDDVVVDVDAAVDPGGDPAPDASVPDCEPTSATEQACDRFDDDCNGIVDDVDRGGDGFCDCYSVVILGNPGPTADSDFDAWLEKSGIDVTRIGTDAGHVLTAEQIAAFDIVMLDLLARTYSEEEAAILRAYVERGNGLIALAGYVNEVNDRVRQSSLTRAVGLRFVAPLYNQPTGEWADHPIADGVASVEFYGGWAIQAIGAEPLGDVVLSVAGGPEPLAVAKSTGDGRAFVYGDEWISFDGEWQNSRGMTALWQNILRWVGPAWECSTRG